MVSAGMKVSEASVWTIGVAAVTRSLVYMRKWFST